MGVERIKSWYQRKLKADWRSREKDEESPLKKYELGFTHAAENRNGIPTAVLESYDFYYGHVESQDWGSVRTYRIKIDGRDTYAIRVTTDGDTCCLEVFDDQGVALGAAIGVVGEDLSWDSTRAVRDQLLAQ